MKRPGLTETDCQLVRAIGSIIDHGHQASQDMIEKAIKGRFEKDIGDWYPSLERLFQKKGLVYPANDAYLLNEEGTRLARDTSLDPTETHLGKSLSRWGLTFQTWDFTEDEREYWRKSLRFAGGLQTAFEAEGNRTLYESRVRESQRELEAVEAGQTRRFLYHVTMKV